MKYSNVIYTPVIKKISGITTWLKEIAKKYQDLDITIMYSDDKSDIEQLLELRKYVRVIKLNDIVKCSKLFITNLASTEKFDADEVIGVIHTKYSVAGLKPYGNKVDKVVAISKEVANDYEKITGIKPIVCYNPLTVGKQWKVLKLITATRITKGKHRLERLAKRLDNSGIPYIWYILSNGKLSYNSKNIIYLEPRVDIKPLISICDYLVQLSDDDEGYSYSINEALSLGVPIISTPLSIFKELNIRDGKEGYLIDFEALNIDIDKIYNEIPKVAYTPPKDGYNELFDNTRTNYIKSKFIKLVCIRPYKDIEYNRHINLNEEIDTYEERAKSLVEKGFVEYYDEPINKDNKIKVDIIIPLYNQENLIVRTLNSIPERDNVRTIVIDDKSTDNSVKVVKEYIKEHKNKNIKLLENKENKGVGYTFNRGLEEADADYIVRIDSDDYFYTNQFNKMIDKELDGTDMIYYNLEDNNERILEVNKRNRHLRCGAVKFIRRKFIDNIRCPEIRTAEDKAFNDSLLLKYPTEKFTNRVVYHYNYPRENSLTDLTKRGLL